MKILSCEITGTAVKVSALAVGRTHAFVARDLATASKMLAKTDHTLNPKEAGEQLDAFLQDQAADTLALAA